MFEAANLIGGSGQIAQLHMVGSSTSCEKCGGPAVIGDGVYTYNAGMVDLIRGTSLTRKMVERLGDIAERARAAKIEAEELIAEVAGVSPELAEKLKARWPLPAFVIIIVLFWIVKSVNLDIKIDLNHLIEQAYHLFRGEDPEQHLNEVPLLIPPRSRDELPSSKLVDQQSSRPNRQARRRAQALARKWKPRP